jgi:hypothetical protein
MSVLGVLPRRPFALIALLALSLAACSDSTEPLPAEGTFTGRWSGEPWVGEAYAVLIDGGDAGDTLYLGGSRPVNAESMPLESIRIRVLFRGVGTYQLGSSGTNTAQFDELTGGDVVHATYSATGLNPGTLVITSYEGPGGQIEGGVSFVSVSASPYRSYGAISSFEDGRFRATVNTYP